MTVIGRFAPSPTGPLHAGSVVAALASWLDVRAAGGRWLVRIEDVDRERCPPGMDQVVLGQLAALGLRPDEPPWVQSQRGAAYAQALEQLRAAGRAYACGCTRKAIDEALAAAGQVRPRHGERVYPGTCRHGLQGGTLRAWRLRTDGPGGEDRIVDWHDRRLGPQRQNVTRAVGDFTLARADGGWTYQLAVVVDDAAQGITDVVRGEDLADNTPRQILLQQALGLPRPRYRHTPLVLAADGQKLSKQNGAQAIDTRNPLRVLQTAAAVLALPVPAPAEGAPPPPLGDWLAAAVRAWTTIEGSSRKDDLPWP